MDALRRIVQALRVSSRNAEQELGLSGAQLLILQVLGKESPLSINELAERTRTHQSSVSIVVSKLEKSGHVERAPSKVDARRTDVSLATSGKRLLNAAPPLAQERLLAAIRTLTENDQKDLARLMNQVIQAAGFTEQSPSLFFEEESASTRRKKS